MSVCVGKCVCMCVGVGGEGFPTNHKGEIVFTLDTNAGLLVLVLHKSIHIQTEVPTHYPSAHSLCYCSAPNLCHLALIGAV